MSDDTPTVKVTRGKRHRRTRSKTSNSASSGLDLPSPLGAISGMVRGARNAWWAGLGLLAVARKAGTQVFEALVEEGKSWEQARRKRTEQTVQQVQQLTEENDAVRIAEEQVRDQINAALRRMGVPNRDEIDTLRERIDALGEQIKRVQNAASDARPGSKG